MSQVEIAKELLKKGILLEDQELISLANKLLDDNIKEKEETIETPKRKMGRPKKVESKKAQTTSELISSFAVERKEKTSNKTPVRGGKNTWTDDGSDDETGKLRDKAVTPNIKLTPRGRRKQPEKVKVICGQGEKGKKRDDEGCGKEELVLAKLAREFYLCEECINNKIKRG